MTADHELLQRYCRDREEPAFAELVRRHGGMVLAAAMRQVGQREAAEEITQAVFSLLARKAGAMGPGIPLAAWLHKATRHESMHFVRGEARRRNREQLAAAAAMNEDSTNDGPKWASLSPVLDEALAHLPEVDREALLLRFFHDLSLRDVGAALKSTEEAAKKRVSRALEKLRGVLTRRGIASTTAGLALALATHAPAAPLSAATAAAVTTQALAGAASAGGSGLFTTLLSAMTTAKLTVAAALAAFAVPIALQVRENVRAAAPPSVSVDKSKTSARTAPAPQPSAPAAGTAPGAPLDPRLARIAAELPALQGKEPDPERLLAVIGFVFDLAPEQLPEALELLQGTYVSSVFEALFARWAQVDPHAAAAEADKLKSGATTTAWAGLLSVWMLKDSTAAIARIEQMEQGFLKEVITCTAFRRLVNARPDEAIAKAATLSDKRLAAYGRKMALEVWAEKDPDKVMAWIREQEPEDKQADAEKLVLDSMGIERPEESFRVAMQNENFHQKSSSALFALQQMAVTHPQETVEKLLGLPADLQTHNAATNVALALEHSDPRAVDQLIAKLPPSEFRDGFLMSRYNRPGTGEPADAVTGAMEFFNESRRNQLVKIQFPGWAKKDRAAATAWLQAQTALPDSLKEQLLNQ